MQKKLTLLFLLFASVAYAQKKPIDHSVYDNWESVGIKQASNDGNWSAFGINKQEGDGNLYFQQNQTAQKITIPRGTGTGGFGGGASLFSADSKFAAFTIKPLYKDVRQAKIKKKKPDEMTKDTLGIANLTTLAITKIPRVKSYKFPENGNAILAYLLEKPLDTSKEENITKKLAYEYNSMHFEYASTLYEQKQNIEYSYQLKGYDDEWSLWSSKSEKDYTNLPHGKYTFLVKARNNLGNESEPTSYSFVISPPWYNSNLAYVFYFLIFACLVYLLIKLQEKEHLKQQDKLRQKHQLEIERNEQQITKLQKKQLEADVEFKNKELATTTMHLVQRGKLLSKIGDELLPLVEQTTSKDTANDLKKVIRLLNEAKKLDNDWNQFAIHFDHVHANFLTNLKNNFPNLSPSDLKLCAYLKLNLSSKEIAQLLNITPRAVEVSRYRLRKKLALKPEVNLFDFLLNNAVKST